MNKRYKNRTLTAIGNYHTIERMDPNFNRPPAPKFIVIVNSQADAETLKWYLGHDVMPLLKEELTKVRAHIRGHIPVFYDAAFVKDLVES